MLIIAVLLTALMITVMLTDITRYIIPNWLVALVLALYIATISLMHIPDWPIAFAIGLACFALGFLLFITKIMGGGDIKLLAVTALFAGKSAFPPFIMDVGLLGGFLALVLLTFRPVTAYIFGRIPNAPPIPRVLTIGEPVPYGVAIATAFLIILWTGKMPGFAL